MGAEDERFASSGDTAQADGDAPCVSALRCSPDRTVFTEDHNDGGWISTDTTVDVER